MMQIRDPIHGYISLDGMYADIVNTPEFQRLRSIEQGSFRPVFPGARHDRFIHSLGTYHLAVKFADHFFRNLEKDLGITTPNEDSYKATFLCAALLHDVGHAPFSHTTENFFTEPKVPGKNMPQIWKELVNAIAAINSDEGELFDKVSEKVGAAHEIASSFLTVKFFSDLTNHHDKDLVMLPLAARMIIGFTYEDDDLKITNEERGIRNCLIRLLNADIMDVDRLDYLGRDTQMSGYVNAPLDLECLAASVTAVKLDNGQLAPAFRDSALRVFDLMFQAKLSHDTWVLASPAGLYDAALKAHCIRECYSTNMEKVFSVQSLSIKGHDIKNLHDDKFKRYRLLSDVDVEADLKACNGGAFDELYTRVLGKRRVAVWRSYYEYNHLFSATGSVTPKSVYDFFQPLLKHMKDHHIFEFNKTTCAEIIRTGDAKAKAVAEFLRDYLVHLPGAEDPDETYNVVLLDKSIDFTIKKVNPEHVYITFPKWNIPEREDGRNYSTYSELTGVLPAADADMSKPNPYARSNDYFYMFRHGGLTKEQLKNLREKLAPVV